MTNIQKLLARQAAWQKSRTALPWPQKIRLAEAMLPTIKALRASNKPKQKLNRRDAEAQRENNF